MKCPKCGGTTFSSEFTAERGMVMKCLLDGAVFTEADCVAEEESPAAPPPRAKVQATTTPKAFVTSKDVVRDAKAQLRELEAEIRRLQKLIPQRDALKRLLAAASQEKARNKAVAKK